jgi:low affinity Fe/Cu permease
MTDLSRMAGAQHARIGILHEVIDVSQRRKVPAQISPQRRFMRLHFLEKPTDVFWILGAHVKGCEAAPHASAGNGGVVERIVRNLGPRHDTMTPPLPVNEIIRTCLRPRKPASAFTRLSKWTSRTAGRPTTFILAVSVIAAWGISGVLFNFSDTWQLVINTGTTIVTFLMVFLIQATQNRDSEAIHVKLDELIRALKGAENTLLDLEDMDEEQLNAIRSNYTKLAAKARKTGLGKSKSGASAAK